MIKAALALDHMLMAAAQRDIWQSLGGAIDKNQTLSVLGLLVVAFSAGFGVRKLFEDRDLNMTKATLADVKAQFNIVQSHLNEIKKGDEEQKARLARISRCLLPDQLKATLGEHLKQWPAEKHDLLVVAIIRQLLSIPGRAWLFTPKVSALVKVEFEAGACHITTESNSAADPVKELRELVAPGQALNVALLDAAIHGITSVLVKTGPKESTRLVVRQGPGLSWTTQREILQHM